MKSTTYKWLFAAFLLSATSALAADAIDEIIVTADFRERPVSELPLSVTVMSAEFIEEAAVQHFEELVNLVPNLNWSGDGHRARYFQIRGVGELSQYQGAPNPSVGFIVDDIDFSGIGTIATLFDIDHIEVLRGPQGTRYGANALGGLIYMQSALPSAERNGRLQISAGDDDAFSAGIAFGGAFDGRERALFRFSAHHHQSNGGRHHSGAGDAPNPRQVGAHWTHQRTGGGPAVGTHRGRIDRATQNRIRDRAGNLGEPDHRQCGG